MTQRTEAQQIIDRCLGINDFLKTIKKSLEADGQEIDGFSDHYSDLIQQVIDKNWENHELAYELTHKDYKLEKIRDLVN